MYDAITLIKEFVADVEAAGVSDTEATWPDLVHTYINAKQFLHNAGATPEQGDHY